MAIIKNTFNMSEKDIQQELYRRYSQGKLLLAPNIYLFDWESDFLTVTNSHYSHEYEIKLSKSDFKADFFKVEKHLILQNGFVEHDIYQYDNNGNKILKETKVLNKSRPNYFWYVSPSDIIAVDDIPDYAGLVHVSKYCHLSVEKKAPKIHKNKLPDNYIRKAFVSLYHRYCDLRTKYRDKL